MAHLTDFSFDQEPLPVTARRTRRFGLDLTRLWKRIGVAGIQRVLLLPGLALFPLFMGYHAWEMRTEYRREAELDLGVARSADMARERLLRTSAGLSGRTVSVTDDEIGSFLADTLARTAHWRTEDSSVGTLARQLHDAAKRLRNVRSQFATGLAGDGRQMSSPALINASANVEHLLGQISVGALHSAEMRRAQIERQSAIGLVLSFAVAIGCWLAFRTLSNELSIVQGRLLSAQRALGMLPEVPFRLRVSPVGDCRVEYVGEGIQALFGVDPRAALADFSVVWSLILDEDRNEFDNAVAAAEQRLGALRVEFRIKSNDEALKWLRTVANLTGEPDGSIVWQGYWLDITAEKHQRHTAETTVNRLKALIRSLPGVLAFQYRCTQAGTLQVEFASGSLRGLSASYSQETMRVDQGLSDSVAPEDRLRFHGLLVRGSTKAENWSAELAVNAADGTKFPVRMDAIPEKAEDGEVLWLAYWTDIEQLIQMKSEVQEQTVRAEMMLEGVPDPIVMTDAEGRIAVINSRMIETFGYSRSELIGKPVEILIPERLRKAHAASRADYQGSPIRKNMGTRRQIVAMRKDASEFAADVSLSPVVAGGGTMIISAIRDVSERAAMEKELRAAKEAADSANSAKSAFLAAMSHEIRTPMNGVLGTLELLSLTDLDARQRTAVEVIRQSGNSLVRIIDDILDFSKIEAGSLEIRKEPASIAEIVRAVASLYSGTATSRGLSLEVRLDARIAPAAMLDPLRLQQVLNNLVSNAIKFTANGSVTISGEVLDHGEDNQLLRIAIRDTGIGISPQQQRRLFAPFVQADSQTTRMFGGTGLGLAICKRIVELMDGTVSLQSTPNVGTEVEIKLRVETTDPAEIAVTEKRRTCSGISTRQRREPPTVDEAEKEGSLVLIVEDHGVNRMVLMQQVATLGYAVEAAENGLAGLERWKTHRYGMIITDCHMPEMDGCEMAKTIREIEKSAGGHTPIIACTANALADELERCFLAGMDDYIAKPLSLADVARKLDHWLPVAQPEEEYLSSGARDAGAAGVLVIDRNVFDLIGNGVPEVRREAAALFRMVNDEDSIQLRDAVKRHDVARAANLTHRIKGAARTIGAVALADQADALGRACLVNDWLAATAEMRHYEDQLLQVNAFLEAV